MSAAVLWAEHSPSPLYLHRFFVSALDVLKPGQVCLRDGCGPKNRLFSQKKWRVSSHPFSTSYFIHSSHRKPFWALGKHLSGFFVKGWNRKRYMLYLVYMNPEAKQKSIYSLKKLLASSHIEAKLFLNHSKPSPLLG